MWKKTRLSKNPISSRAARALRVWLVVAVISYIIMPILINALNLLVNLKDIRLFTSRYPQAVTLREKDAFFIDGRFLGFRNDPSPLRTHVLIAERLECHLTPGDTVYRLVCLKKTVDGAYKELGNVSFSGELKKNFFKNGISDIIYGKIENAYGEGIESIGQLNRLKRRK